MSAIFGIDPTYTDLSYPAPCNRQITNVDQKLIDMVKDLNMLYIFAPSPVITYTLFVPSQNNSFYYDIKSFIAMGKILPLTIHKNSQINMMFDKAYTDASGNIKIRNTVYKINNSPPYIVGGCLIYNLI